MQMLGSKRIRTTAYHPIANGLVELFHSQLKAALKASLDPTNWVDMLPTVLLKICTCLKKDLKSSTAELVYEQPYVYLETFPKYYHTTESGHLCHKTQHSYAAAATSKS